MIASLHLGRISTTFAGLLISSAVTFAGDLNLGSKAPALSVEAWLKGSAIQEFQVGQTYVVEFWATWCRPCLQSIPHLTELQKKYAAKKVSVLGIAGSERGDSEEQIRAKLDKFVAEQGDGMAYTIAYDNNRSMSQDWMEAAKQGGIPTAFVVNGNGQIAWIGHPLEMDEPLAQIVAGTWDLEAEAAKAKAKAELEAKLDPIMQKVMEAANAGDWDAAILAINEGIALGEAAEQQLAWFKYNLHLEKKDYEGAFAYLAQCSQAALKDDAQFLNAAAWSMVDPEQAERMEQKNLGLALACAQRACVLSKGKAEEPMMLDTQAAVHAAKGDLTAAIECQSRAVELMQDKEGAAEYQEKLETYRKAKG